jgi:ubiquinone/menaquinone biosynthesis C-methylase UbiE
VGDVHSLPFIDECFDTVTSLGTLEHFKHPERAVAEMNRVLKEDGTLIVTTDAPANILFTIGDFIRTIEYRIRGTLLTQPVDNRIPKKKVMEILAANGFRVVFHGEYSARVVQTDRYTRILKKLLPEKWLRGSFVFFFYCKKGTFDRYDGYGPFFPIR